MPGPNHWTYDECPSVERDLYQGDIVARTPELEALLKEVHSYFLESKFISFVVTTQTCDLAVRGAKGCKAEHINLAAVRELEPILPEIVGKQAGTAIPGIYKQSSRVFAVSLLKKIINQNEVARGLFYLHPDADAGIVTPCVAMLRITIAVRKEHYKLLQQARCGRLDTEFRNKLGWLKGHLYSRIAAPDWDEVEGPGSEDQAARLLNSIDGEEQRYWVPESWIEAAKQNSLQFDGMEREQAVEILKQHAPPERLQVAINAVKTNFLKLIVADQALKLKEAAVSSEEFAYLVGDHCLEQCKQLSGSAIAGLDDAVESDGKLINAVAHGAFIAFRTLLSTNADCTAAEIQAEFQKLPFTATVANPVRKHAVALLKDQTSNQSLASLDLRPLLSQEAIDFLVKTTAAVRQTGLVSPEKLVNRLQNDEGFKMLARAQPEASFEDDD